MLAADAKLDDDQQQNKQSNNEQTKNSDAKRYLLGTIGAT
jgi:hypothetical protein